jgi:hypothetical protein
VQHAAVDVALDQLRQVQPGAEVLPSPLMTTALQSARAGCTKQRVQLLDQRVGQRIALGRAVQAHVHDGAAVADLQQSKEASRPVAGVKVVGHRGASPSGAKIVHIESKD